MPIFDHDELTYAEFVKRDVERRMQELEEMFPSSAASTPTTPSLPTTRRQRLEQFTITSVAPAAPSPAVVASLSSPASSTTPPSWTPASPTSIDTTTLKSTATREPLQPLPARCSTAGLTQDASATSAPLSTSSWTSAAPTPPPATTTAASPSTPARAVLCAEKKVFITTPIRCLNTTTTILSTPTNSLDISADSSQSNTNKNFSFECSKQRYITNCIPAYPIEMFPCLVNKVYERNGDQYSVVLWPSFTGCLGLPLSRQPWPPPIPF